MLLNEYIEALSKAIQKLDDYGLAEVIEFNSELRGGKKQFLISKLLLLINPRYISESI